jgi:hypothetical protein
MAFFLLLGVVLVLTALIFLMFSVRVIFHRSHKFPETSAGHNRELRKRGITCPRQEETKCWPNKGKSPGCSTCFEHARD